MRTALILGLLLVVTSSLHASSPGQPMDCGDWVMVAPGLSCLPLGPVGALPPSSVFLEPASPSRAGDDLMVDNAGRILAVRFTILGPFTGCPTCSRGRTELVATDGQTETLLAYVEDRDTEFNLIDHLRPLSCANPCAGQSGTAAAHPAAFDPVHGRVLVPMQSYCTMKSPESMDCPVSGYAGGYWFIAIGGLPTLFDNLMTFVPGQPALQIATAAMPDGFRSADAMQVWTGSIRSMPDWSRAEPLTCETAAIPIPGQVVGVPDSLPDPPLGEGRYYLVASQSGSERRLGRQQRNGVFSARDPIALPVCRWP